MRICQCLVASCFFAVRVFAGGDPLACRSFADEWSIDPARGTAEWGQDAGSIDATRAYIVECRLEAKHGAFWLKVNGLDAQGNITGEAIEDKPFNGAGCRWFVIQWQPGEHARSLRISAGGDAPAVFSQLRVMPSSPRTLGNADFSATLDRKRRIPLWNKETDRLLPTPASGTISSNPAIGHAQNGSVMVVTAGGWCAASSINYPVPAWSDRFRAEAFASAMNGGTAQVALVWSGEAPQAILRVDLGDEVHVTDWTRISMPAATPPAGATSVRVALIARAQPVAFDDANLVADTPLVPVVRVLTNQAGHDGKYPLSAVVMTNALPGTGATAGFSVLNADGSASSTGPLEYAGRIVGGGGADWGWYFWRAPRIELKKPGRYRIRAILGDFAGESHPFDSAPGRLLLATAAPCVDFFYVQRCGCNVPGWHKPCHMDDAKMPDGTQRDLTGGWHSAGDYNKITWEYGDGGVTYALATLLGSAPELCARSNRDGAHDEDAMEEAQWGAQYLEKLQTDAGGFYKTIQQGPDRQTWMKWAAPDVHTDNVRGTADDPIVLEGEGHSPLAIGAWARLSAILDGRQDDTDYLQRAVKAWDHVSPNATGDPLLLISTIDLYGVTKNSRYKEYARESAEAVLAKAPPQGMLGGGYAESGDVPAAALAHFVIEMPSDPLKPRIKARLRSHIDAILAEPRNAFGISRQKFGADGYFFEPTSALGHNYEYLCRAWSALKVSRALRDKRPIAYALDQINFVLGENPYDLCMMEGVGAVNPPRYHHRYIKIPGHELGKIPGEIPNGFVRDMTGNDRPGFDMSRGGREYPSYRTSEPWLVHNVFYLLAVTALHDVER